MDEEYEKIKKYFLEQEKDKEEIDIIKSKYMNNMSNNKVNENLQIKTNIDKKSNQQLITKLLENKLNNSDENIKLPSFDIGENSNMPMICSTFRRDNKVKDAIEEDENKNNRSKSELGRDKMHVFITSPDYKTEFNTSSYMGSPVIQHLQQNTTKVTKPNCLNFGRIYDEKSKSSNNILVYNKGVIKNIESNITELKNHLSTYENAYDDINKKLEIVNKEPEKTKNDKLGNINRELHSKLKLKDDEIRQMKELYENELKIKNEIYKQNILHLNKTHQEEISKTRIEYEDKVDQIIKKSEEEKIDLMKRISEIEKNSIIKNSKSELNEKNGMIDFQKKYLNDMIELQKAFEDFKTKSYEEFKDLKKSKEEVMKQLNFYKENFLKLKDETEQNEIFNQGNNKEMDVIKKVLKNNENLKNELEQSKSELNFLKMKILKLENFERNVQGFILNNQVNQNSTNINDNPNIKNKNILLDMNYITEGEVINQRNNLFSNKSSDIVNYENNSNVNKNNYHHNMDYKIDNDLNIFSPPGTKKHNSNYGKEGTDYYDYYGGNFNQNRNSGTLDENLYKVIDLKKAHQKIKEMEDCLRSMNDENENLKGKLGYAINSVNTPHNFNTNNSENYNHQMLSPNQYISTGLNIYKHSNQIIPMMNNSNNNSQKLNKPTKKVKTYSINMVEEPYKLHLDNNNYNNDVISQSGSNTKSRTRDLTPTLQKSSRNNNNLSIKNNRDETDIQSSNSIINNSNNTNKHKKKNTIVSYISNSGSRSNLNNYSNNDETDLMETIEDNIIEFPLQLKIKGKIKKISATSNKKMHK